MEHAPSTGLVGMERHRLAAVAFADIVGYSILMAKDERRTHARSMALLNGVLRPAVLVHNGRVVKTTGDGVLAEFPDPRDAVRWALAIQSRPRTPSAESDRDGTHEPLELRIGIHVDDIIDASDDIYGNGVNIAARLQDHAEPGGIILSAKTHNAVSGHLSPPARDLGFIRLKNFEQPLHVYAIDPPHGRVAVPAVPNLEPLPSIAVLPFRNIGLDPSQDYFAAGLVEDIIVSLSGLRELMVIARTSTVTYQQREADVSEVGRALGVRYVMTGSVRRSARGVRVAMHLFHAQSGASLWGDTTDASFDNLFEVQDRIVERIVAGIAPQVRAEELRRAMRKRPENFTAYDCTLRALALMNRLDRHDFGKAHDFLAQALDNDPGFAMAAAWMARWYSINIGQGWAEDSGRDAERAWLHASRAIELDRQNALALATYGHLRSRLFRDFDAALLYLERALAACPNSSLAWSLSALTLAYVGQAPQAVEHAEHALRLSPLDSAISFYYTNLAYAHYAVGAYANAAKWARMATNENPMFTANLRLLSAALTALGLQQEASAASQAILQQEPNFTLAQYRQTRQPFRDREIAGRFLEHLRRAGLPE